MTTLEIQTQTLPSTHFEDGDDPRTTSDAEKSRMQELNLKMSLLGHPITELKKFGLALTKTENLVSREIVEGIVNRIHNAVTILDLQWNFSHQNKDGITATSTAKLLNGLTGVVREIDKKYKVFDKTHLEQLHDSIVSDLLMEKSSRESNQDYTYNPMPLAQVMEKTARERTHEFAWPWMIRPTFPDQHYGRILLDVVLVEGIPFRVFVTQPTFANGEATLFHTHGQNWGLSAPLGKTGENRHINTLWTPYSRDNLFPLQQLPSNKGGKTYYFAGQNAIISPKTIHGITGASLERKGMSLEEFTLLSESGKQTVLKEAKIGEQSCLHMYRGDMFLVQDFIDHPVELTPNKPEKDFFESNDMIVFNHKLQEAWPGGAGAWEPRCMIQYGSKGENCGICYRENNSRGNKLPPNIVYDRFIDSSWPELMRYTTI